MMLRWFSDFIDSLAPSKAQRRATMLHPLSLVLVSLAFLVGTTVIVAFDSLFPSQQDVSTLSVGSLNLNEVRAPYTLQYESEVLTSQQRQAAASAVASVYNAPDPTIARQQVTLLQRILDFIDNIRRDPYASAEQKTVDFQAISAISFEPELIEPILTIDDDTWRALSAEATIVLERVMREPIREIDLPSVVEQLPSQVAVRFDPSTAAIIVALVGDVIRPNRFQNLEATARARELAAAQVPPVVRSFERGQVIVRAAARLDAVDYETLQRFGLLGGDDQRGAAVARALPASALMLVLAGLYLARFYDPAYMRARFLTILCTLFLLSLLGTRIFAAEQTLYVMYPAAGLALLLVVITKPEIALLGTLIQAVLVGMMADNSLEIVTLVLAGGMVGALLLRRTERLNSYFTIGVVIALVNVAVVAIFNIGLLAYGDSAAFSTLVLYALINGVLTAMVALVGMYALTFFLNLPTSLKLVDLSQPNQPLLQRLLRTAPGTYQHSLQVANLCEQAANAIGANVELIRVAALYHDIGKTLDPAFFVENQADNVNPHDALNDPYRSADIIIGHVTEGAELARQSGLPVRIRDFILEHHGTLRVVFFYAKAVEQAGDREDSVDVDAFTYPGPKPQTRETAILMLADVCESTVRARKPANKQEIADIVDSLFKQRMGEGQLDEADLTLRDLDLTRDTFIEMLQGVFHPRINYPGSASVSAGERAHAHGESTRPEPQPAAPLPRSDSLEAVPPHREAVPGVLLETQTLRRSTTEVKPVAMADDEDEPLEEVPPLRRSGKNTPPTRRDEEAR